MWRNLFTRNLIASKYVSIVDQINALENKFKLLTDSELKEKIFEIKKKYQKEQNLNHVIPESFALTREASKRTLGLRHFDVQLIGGLVLNDENIAEMKTGEGKTLVATLPASLNALTEKGVHIVTVNEYLASRDQISMGQIYRLLGLSTGLIQEKMNDKERWENYDADITYVTNSQLAFDYLRDNTTLKLKTVVLKQFNYCIIDEVDAILIDEARTPLVISTPAESATVEFVVADELIKYLRINTDFKVDRKNNNIVLFRSGCHRIERILDIDDIYDRNRPWIVYILNALRANMLYFSDVQYIIQNKKINIVDEFTGRIMPGRRWGDGLHQAIETKAGVPIRRGTETNAKISYQSFFGLYPKLSGMTGTGKTSEVEFERFYDLSVDQVPTARPNKRIDLPDLIYKDQFSKWNAVVKECQKTSSIGQPMLVATTTIAKCEMLSQLLTEYKIPHEVLNAKEESARRESQIVAKAGKKGSITVSTNMSGRGTDIILGGNIGFEVRRTLYTLLVHYKNRKEYSNLNPMFPLADDHIIPSQKLIQAFLILIKKNGLLDLSDADVLKLLDSNENIVKPSNEFECILNYMTKQLTAFEKKIHKINSNIVRNLGGLYVLGTERNNSRRIDNQLRGRCGRQGDPGKTRFFLSIDDNLLALYGSPKIKTFIQNQVFDDAPIESKLVTKSLNTAQKRREESDYDARKYIFDYDDVINKQRNLLYIERRTILESQSLRNQILSYGEQIITEMIYSSESNLRKMVNTKPMSYKGTKLNILDRFLLRQIIKLAPSRIWGGMIADTNLFLNPILFVLEDLFGNSLFLKDINRLVPNKSLKLDTFELRTYLFQEYWLCYESRAMEHELELPGSFTYFERWYSLMGIDEGWRDQLEIIDIIRDAVGWRSYAGRDPIAEYRNDCYREFLECRKAIRQMIIYSIFNINPRNLTYYSSISFREDFGLDE